MFQCEDGNFEVVLSCHSLCVDNVKSKGAVRIAFCSDALWSLSPSNLETPLTETEGLDEAASQDAYEVVLEDALLVLGKLVKGFHCVSAAKSDLMRCKGLFRRVESGWGRGVEGEVTKRERDGRVGVR